jgi:hypothetical protein
MVSVLLFIVLGGAAYAATALPANSVGRAQLKNSAVNSAKVRNGSLRDLDLKDGAVSSAKLSPDFAGRIDWTGSPDATNPLVSQQWHMGDMLIDVSCGGTDPATGNLRLYLTVNPVPYNPNPQRATFESSWADLPSGKLSSTYGTDIVLWRVSNSAHGTFLYRTPDDTISGVATYLTAPHTCTFRANLVRTTAAQNLTAYGTG